MLSSEAAGCSQPHLLGHKKANKKLTTPPALKSQTTTHALVLRNYLCHMSLCPKIKRHFVLLNYSACAVGNVFMAFYFQRPVPWPDNAHSTRSLNISS